MTVTACRSLAPVGGKHVPSIEINTMTYSGLANRSYMIFIYIYIYIYCTTAAQSFLPGNREGYVCLEGRHVQPAVYRTHLMRSARLPRSTSPLLIEAWSFVEPQCSSQSRMPCRIKSSSQRFQGGRTTWRDLHGLWPEL